VVIEDNFIGLVVSCDNNIAVGECDDLAAVGSGVSCAAGVKYFCSVVSIKDCISADEQYSKNEKMFCFHYFFY